MKKRMMSLLLSAVMVLSLLPGGIFAVEAAAADTVYDNDTAHYTFRYIEQDDVYRAESYIGSAAYIQVPDTYDDGEHGVKAVAAVGPYFAGSSHTGSGESRVEHFDQVKEVKLGDNITRINDEAFHRAKALEKVIFNKTSHLTAIGQYAFGRSFSDMEDNSLQYVGYYDSASKTYKLPASLSSVSIGAFYGTDSLEYLDLSETKVLVLPNSFLAASGVKSVKLNAGTTSIGISTFNDCYRLTTLDIPKSVAYIDGHAFEGCNALNTLYLRCGVPAGNNGWGSIGTDALRGLKKGCTVYMPKPADNAAYQEILQAVYGNPRGFANGNVKLRWISNTTNGTTGSGTTTAQTAPVLNGVKVNGSDTNVTYKNSNGQIVSSFTYNASAANGIGAIIEVEGKMPAISLEMVVNSTSGIFGGWQELEAYAKHLGTDRRGYTPLRGEELNRRMMENSYIELPTALNKTVSLSHLDRTNPYGVYYFFPSLVHTGTYAKPQSSLTALPVVVIYKPSSTDVGMVPSVSGGARVDEWYPDFDNGIDAPGYGNLTYLTAGGEVLIPGYEAVLGLDSPLSDTSAPGYNATYQWYISGDNRSDTPGDDNPITTAQPLQYEIYDRPSGKGVYWHYDGIDEVALQNDYCNIYGAHYFYCRVTVENGSAANTTTGTSGIYTLAVTHDGRTNAVTHPEFVGFSGSGDGGSATPYEVPHKTRNLYLDAHYDNEGLPGIDVRYEWRLNWAKIADVENHYPNLLISTSPYCTFEEINAKALEYSQSLGFATVSNYSVNLSVVSYCGDTRLGSSVNSSLSNATTFYFRSVGTAPSDPKGIVHFGEDFPEAVASSTHSDIRADGAASFAINVPITVTEGPNDLYPDMMDTGFVAIMEQFNEPDVDYVRFELYEVPNATQNRGGTKLLTFDTSLHNLIHDWAQDDGSSEDYYRGWCGDKANLASFTYRLPDASPRYVYVKVTQYDDSEGKTYTDYSPAFLLLPDLTTCESNIGALGAPSARIDADINGGVEDCWITNGEGTAYFPMDYSLYNVTEGAVTFGAEYFEYYSGTWEDYFGSSTAQNASSEYIEGSFTSRGTATLGIYPPPYFEWSDYLADAPAGVDYVRVRAVILDNHGNVLARGKEVKLHIAAYDAELPTLEPVTTTGGDTKWDADISAWVPDAEIAASTNRFISTELKDYRTDGDDNNQPGNEGSGTTFTAQTNTSGASVSFDLTVGSVPWRVTYENGAAKYTEVLSGKSNTTGILVLAADSFTTYGGTHVNWEDKYLTAAYTNSGSRGVLTIPVLEGLGAQTITLRARAVKLDGSGAVTMAGNPGDLYHIYINTNQFAAAPSLYTYSSNGPSDFTIATGETENLPSPSVTVSAYSASAGSVVTWQWYKNSERSTHGAAPIPGASGSFVVSANTQSVKAPWQLLPEDVDTAGTWYYYCEATVTDPACTVSNTASAVTDIYRLLVAENVIRVPSPVVTPSFTDASLTHLIGTDLPEGLMRVTVADPPLTAAADGSVRNFALDVYITAGYGTYTRKYLVGSILSDGTAYPVNGTVTDNGNGTHTFIYTGDPDTLGLNSVSALYPICTLTYSADYYYEGYNHALYTYNASHGNLTSTAPAITVYQRGTVEPAISAVTLDSDAMLSDGVTLGGDTYPAFHQYDSAADRRSVTVTVNAVDDEAPARQFLALEAYNETTEQWENISLTHAYARRNSDGQFLDMSYTLPYNYPMSASNLYLAADSYAYPVTSGEAVPLRIANPYSGRADVLFRVAAYQALIESNDNYVSNISASQPAYSDVFAIHFDEEQVNAVAPTVPGNWPDSSEAILWDTTHHTVLNTDQDTLTLGIDADWAVTDGGTVTYQWYLRKKNQSARVAIPGAADRTLTVSAEELEQIMTDSFMYSSDNLSTGGDLILVLVATNNNPGVSGTRSATAEAMVTIQYSRCPVAPAFESVPPRELTYGETAAHGATLSSPVSNVDAVKSPTYYYFLEVVSVDGVEIPAADRYRNSLDPISGTRDRDYYTLASLYTKSIKLDKGTSASNINTLLRNGDVKELVFDFYVSAKNYDLTHIATYSPMVEAPAQRITLRVPEVPTDITKEYSAGGERTVCTDVVPSITDGRDVVLTAPDAPEHCERLDYQWQHCDRNGTWTNIYGEKSQSLRITGSNFSSDYPAYRCVITFVSEYYYAIKYTEASEPITIAYVRAEAMAPAFFYGIPGETVSVDPDQDSTYTVNAFVDDFGTLSYQWKKDGADLPGETSATLHYNLPEVGKHVYTCEVTNTRADDKTASSTFTLTVFVRGIVVDDIPSVPTVADGETVTVSVTATAYGFGASADPASVPVSWTSNAISGSNWLVQGDKTEVFSKANTAVLTLTLSGAANGTSKFSVAPSVEVSGKTYTAATKTFTVSTTAFTVDTVPLPFATMEEAYEQSLTIRGSSALPPITWTVTDWDGLEGMSIVGDKLTGTPRLPGRYHLAVTAEDANHAVSSAAVELVVQSKASASLSEIWCGSECHQQANTKSYSGPGWSWDHGARVLTLTDYTGPGFAAMGYAAADFTKADCPLYVKLVGSNKLTGPASSFAALCSDSREVFLVGDGTLSIDMDSPASSVNGIGYYYDNNVVHIGCGNVSIKITSDSINDFYGIRSNVDMTGSGGDLTIEINSAKTARAIGGNLTVSGNRKVSITTNYNGEGTSFAHYAVYGDTLISENAQLDVSMKAAGTLSQAIPFFGALSFDTSADCTVAVDTSAATFNSSTSLVGYNSKPFSHTGSGKVDFDIKLGTYTKGSVYAIDLRNATLTGSGAMNVDVSAVQIGGSGTSNTLYALEFSGTPTFGSDIGKVTVNVEGGNNACGIYASSATTLSAGTWEVHAANGVYNTYATERISVGGSATANLEAHTDSSLSTDSYPVQLMTGNSLTISSNAKVNLTSASTGVHTRAGGELTVTDNAQLTVDITGKTDNAALKLAGPDRLTAEGGNVTINVANMQLDGVTPNSNGSAASYGSVSSLVAKDCDMTVTVVGGAANGAGGSTTYAGHSAAIHHLGSGELTMNVTAGDGCFANAAASSYNRDIYLNASGATTITATGKNGCVANNIFNEGTGEAVLTGYHVAPMTNAANYALSGSLTNSGSKLTLNSFVKADDLGAGTHRAIGEAATVTAGNVTVNAINYMADGTTLNATGSSSPAVYGIFGTITVSGGSLTVNAKADTGVYGTGGLVNLNGGNLTLNVNGTHGYANASGVGVKQTGGSLKVNAVYTGKAGTSGYGLAAYSAPSGDGTADISVTGTGLLSQLVGVNNEVYHYGGDLSITVTNSDFTPYVYGMYSSLTLYDGCGDVNITVNGGSAANVYGLRYGLAVNEGTVGDVNITVKGGSARCYAINNSLGMKQTAGTVTLDATGSTASTTQAHIGYAAGTNRKMYKMTGSATGNFVSYTPLAEGEFELTVTMEKDRIDPDTTDYDTVSLSTAYAGTVTYSAEVLTAPEGVNKDALVKNTTGNRVQIGNVDSNNHANVTVRLPAGVYEIAFTATSVEDPTLTETKTVTLTVDSVRAYLATNDGSSYELNAAAPIALKTSGESARYYALVVSAALNKFTARFDVTTTVPGLDAKIERAEGDNECSFLVLDASACDVGASGTVTVTVTNPEAEGCSVTYDAKVVGSSITTLRVGDTMVSTPDNANASGTGWSWDAAAATLTLDNYTGGSIAADGDDLTIVYKGENTITSSTNVPAVSAGDYTMAVTGEDADAKLHLVSTQYSGISAKAFSFENGQVDIVASYYALNRGFGSPADKLTLKNMTFFSAEMTYTNYTNACRAKAVVIESDAPYYVAGSFSEGLAVAYGTEVPDTVTVEVTGENEVIEEQTTVLGISVAGDLENATFYNADGTEKANAYTYQWHKNDIAIPDATDKTYTAEAEANVGDASSYTCVVTVNLATPASFTTPAFTLTTKAAGSNVTGGSGSHSDPGHEAGVVAHSTNADWLEGTTTVTITDNNDASNTHNTTTIIYEGDTNTTHEDYGFTEIQDGEYTVTIDKDHFAPKEINVTVSGSDLDIDTVDLYMWGDVNGDGKITAADAQEIQRYAALLSSAFDTTPDPDYCIERANVNGDTKVTAADAQEIQRYAAYLSSAIDSK